jgi:ferredoxin
MKSIRRILIFNKWPDQSKYIPLRNFCSSNRDMAHVDKYIESLGFSQSDCNLIKSSFEEMGQQPSISSLKALGANGLRSLLESIERTAPRLDALPIKVNVTLPGGSVLTITGREGDSFQTLAERDPGLRLHMECACGGIAACSTCHVIVCPEWYPKLRKPEEDEVDMIDLAYECSETSRLGCQLTLTKDLDGLEVRLPDGVNNLF